MATAAKRDPLRSDVLIVGAGSLGSTCHKAQEAGFSVHAVEAGYGIGGT